MRKRHLLKKAGTSLIAAALMLSCTASAYAQEKESGAAEDALEASDVIDITKKGSIAIYKYDMTSAEAAGVYTEGSHQATGEADPALQEIMSPYAVEGVEFSYLRCGDIETYSYNGGAAVKLVYEIPEELRHILGLKEADAVSMSDENVSSQCLHTGVWHYTSQQLNDALKNGLENENIKTKSALENYLSTSEKSEKMTLTDQFGYTYADKLQTGLYLIAETKVPEQVTATCNPWLVSLPFTNEGGDWNDEKGGEKWLYDAVCYPKNQTGNPTLDKLVRQSPDCGGDVGYDSTETVSEGDVLDYLLVSKIPHITSQATWLKMYTFKDTLSKGLTYNKDVKIALYSHEEDAINNKTEKAEAIWTTNEFTQSALKDEKSGQTVLTISMTDKGLEKMNHPEQGFSDYYMVVYYTAKVNSDNTTVLGDDGNENDAVLTWKRTSEKYFNTLEDRCVVYAFGLNLNKTFSDGKGNAAKAAFTLFNKDNQVYVVAEEAAGGTYYVTGKTNMKEQATIFKPAESGKLLINGIEGDNYQLTECSTDNGYSILKEGIMITINSTTETIIPSVAGTTGLEAATDAGQAINKNYNGGIVDAEGVNVSESKGVQRQENANGRTIGKTDMYEGDKISASASVDGIDAAMSDADGSVNARVNLNILNSKTFLLPQTGGTGLYAATIIGAIALGLGFVLTRKKRQQA